MLSAAAIFSARDGKMFDKYLLKTGEIGKMKQNVSHFDRHRVELCDIFLWKMQKCDV